MRAALLMLLVAGSIGRLSSSQPPIELTVRHPPQTVRILGVNHLVHELWISSPGPTAVTLSSVTVSSDSRPLAHYQGAELATHVGRPGLPRSHPGAAGARARTARRRVLLASPRPTGSAAVAR